MTTDFDRVRSYYAGFDEWGRLATPEGALELQRTLELVERWLAAPCRVLDLGGGPGRYSVELARRGHRVTLADLSPANLDIARSKFAEHGVEQAIEGIDEVNALDLARYDSASFDAVLALGPFYHLTQASERMRAAAEIARVVRPGGLVFVAYVPRHSGLVGLVERAANRPGQVSADAFREAVESGVFRNQTTTGFQEAYYPQPGELEAMLETAGLTTRASVSLKSLMNSQAESFERLPQDLRKEVRRAAVAAGSDPAVLATSGHVLIIAESPAG